MSNLCKRITAFAVMICMLFCVAPMVAFAEETEPTQLDSITYNFGAIRDHEFTYYDEYQDKDITITYSNANIAGRSIQGRELRAELERLYNEGESNWCYDSTSAEIGTPNFNIYASGRNSEMYIQARNANQTEHLKDVWFAVRIQSPGTGEYKMTLDTALVASGVAGSAYILPGTVTDIDGALTEAAYVGSFSCYGSTTVKNSIVELDNTVSLKAGKDYLLVITVDSANEGNSYLFMNSVTLDVVKNLDSITYDLYLGDNTDLTYTNTAGTPSSFSNANIIAWTNNVAGSTFGATTLKMHEAIAGYYDSGTLNWKFQATDFTHASMTATHNSAYVYHNKFTTGNYFAVTVRSPGTGNYQMTFNYGQNKQGSTKGGVYLFDASVDPATWATATPLFKDYVDYSRNAGSTAITTKVFDATIPMEAGKNYTLVFTNEGAANSGYGGSYNAMYLQDVKLDRVATPETLNTITYDLYLGDNTDLTYTNGSTTSSYSGKNILEDSNAGRAGYAQLKSYYTERKLHWQPLSDDLSHAIMNTTHKSLYIYNTVNSSFTTGNYFAVTVRSPGTGNYQMTFNYGQTTNGSTNGGVYLFDASVDPATWATATPLFKDFVSYSTKANNAVATTTVFDASIPMEAGKEYTLVFTNEGAATSETIHAMYLDSVVLNNASPYVVDGTYYDDFNEANWAALDGDMTVKLNGDAVLGEVRTAGTAIDLNGHTLTVDALSGSVIDSSEGNTGLLATENGNVLFSEDNADIPLYDTAAGGYRLFDYTLELHPTVEPVGTASQKFWFKFHFRVNDAEGAELDQDAYALVAAGGSDFQISTELTWNKTALDTVYFGRNYEGLETKTEKIDTFSKEWATFGDGVAKDTRWLYVVVSGLGSDMEGTLTVQPVLAANGVNISKGTLSYTCGAENA